MSKVFQTLFNSMPIPPAPSPTRNTFQKTNEQYLHYKAVCLCVASRTGCAQVSRSSRDKTCEGQASCPRGSTGSSHHSIVFWSDPGRSAGLCLNCLKPPECLQDRTFSVNKQVTRTNTLVCQNVDISPLSEWQRAVIVASLEDTMWWMADPSRGRKSLSSVSILHFTITHSCPPLNKYVPVRELKEKFLLTHLCL